MPSPTGVTAARAATRPGALVPRPTAARRRLDPAPYLLIAPGMAVALGVSLGPVLYGVWLSLHDWYLLTSLTPTFQGLRGYARLLAEPSFWHAAGRTTVWTLGTVGIELVAGIGFALLLNRATPVARTLSAALLLPWVTPYIVSAYGWEYLLDARTGLVHQALHALGRAESQSVLADPTLALLAITGISGWKGTPFMAIALLAALKAVPGELYEAAQVDGAGARARFRHVTLPLIRDTALVTAIVLGILAFYSFDLAWIMTKGGPGEATTLVGVRVYQAIFVELRPSYAATISSAFLPVLIAATLALLRLRRGE